MIRRVSELNGIEVHATDGYVGKLIDCYLDGTEWVLRYFVVDISDLVLDRMVLIAPYGVEGIDWERRMLKVGVTAVEIERSPELEVNLPVSRQYEVALHRHYEWPEYWGQASFMDTPEMKRMPQPTLPGEADELSHLEMGTEEEYQGDAMGPPEEQQIEPDDEEMREMDFGDADLEGTYSPDLRSCAQISGYAVQATDGLVGHVRDLLFEEEGFLVRFVVVDTRAHGDGKILLIPEEWVRAVIWEERTVHVDMSRRTILGLPAFKFGMPVMGDYERKLYEYVDRQ